MQTGPGERASLYGLDMPPSIRDLLADPLLGLTALAGQHRLDEQVSGVATSEHLDPTPYLGGGELLLTTGMLLPRRAGEVQEYVDRLARSGVLGLGFGVELVHDTVPGRLVRAADSAGLVLLEVDRPTPFIAITRAVSDLIAKEQYAELGRVAQVQQDLTRASVREGPAGVVRGAARLLDGWALMLDHHRSVQHAHPPDARTRVATLRGELDRLQAGGPAAASLVEQGEHVSIHPLTSARRVRGFLVGGSPHRPTAVHRAVLSVSTALLSLAQQRPEGRSGARSGALVRLVRSGAVSDPGLLADLGGAVFRRSEVQVLAITGEGRQLRSVALHLEDEPLEDCLVAREGAGFLAVLSTGDVPPVLRRVRSHDSARVGLSTVVPPSELASGFEQAQRALSLAVARGVPVLTYAEVMSGLLGLADPGDAAAYAQRILRPLVEYGTRTGIDLAGTLQVWLRHHGAFDPAATELGVHRHTLRHRVRRAEQLLGRPLSDPDTRMDLWFALRAVPPEAR